MDHPWTPLDDREKEREREEDATPCPHIHTQESMQWLLASGHERQERDACTMICYRFPYSSKSDDFLQQPVLGSTRRRLRQTFRSLGLRLRDGRTPPARPDRPTFLCFGVTWVWVAGSHAVSQSPKECRVGKWRERGKSQDKSEERAKSQGKRRKSSR